MCSLRGDARRDFFFCGGGLLFLLLLWFSLSLSLSLFFSSSFSEAMTSSDEINLSRREEFSDELKERRSLRVSTESSRFLFAAEREAFSLFSMARLSWALPSATSGRGDHEEVRLARVK